MWECGVSAGSGGSWGCTSDSKQKTALTRMDGEAVLARLADMPVYRWMAKDDARKTPHAGPTAQDFMAAFGLGDNDRMIGFADAQGVLFSAVQGLNAKLESVVTLKDAEIAALKREMAELRLAVEVLMARAASGSP